MYEIKMATKILATSRRLTIYIGVQNYKSSKKVPTGDHPANRTLGGLFREVLPIGGMPPLGIYRGYGGTDMA